MLPAAHRLRRRMEFAATIRGGRRAARGPIVVHLAVLPTEPQSTELEQPTRVENDQLPPRVGFVVPKAVGSAVDRNRVRRRLRHAVKADLASLPANSALVIRVLPGATACPSAVLAERLRAALRGALTALSRTRPDTRAEPGGDPAPRADRQGVAR